MFFFLKKGDSASAQKPILLKNILLFEIPGLIFWPSHFYYYNFGTPVYNPTEARRKEVRSLQKKVMSLSGKANNWEKEGGKGKGKYAL